MAAGSAAPPGTQKTWTLESDGSWSVSPSGAEVDIRHGTGAGPVPNVNLVPEIWSAIFEDTTPDVLHSVMQTSRAMFRMAVVPMWLARAGEDTHLVPRGGDARARAYFARGAVTEPAATELTPLPSDAERAEAVKRLAARIEAGTQGARAFAELLAIALALTGTERETAVKALGAACVRMAAFGEDARRTHDSVNAYVALNAAFPRGGSDRQAMQDGIAFAQDRYVNQLPQPWGTLLDRSAGT